VRFGLTVGEVAGEGEPVGVGLTMGEGDGDGEAVGCGVSRPL